jgi:hypothetical protein
MPSQVGQMLKLAGVDQLLKACATTFEFDCFRPVDPMFNVVALHDDAGSVEIGQRKIHSLLRGHKPKNARITSFSSSKRFSKTF